MVGCALVGVVLWCVLGVLLMVFLRGESGADVEKEREREREREKAKKSPRHKALLSSSLFAFKQLRIAQC